MFRVPVVSGVIHQNTHKRLKSSSSYVRSSFIEYFVDNHGHKVVKSSSVVPLSDPTVPFVNAGMNQFKGVFQGVVDAPCPRAVNSQKCVRVGGKHNDLDLVGTDGHHHTFFEMLGNWSFGDYYKKEACKMAWDLLLGPYRLKPDNLLVTYFSGDAAIGLLEDRECRDIWKNIGVPESRIKGHGARDNFWEMGPSGPCGPCTEIHYVHPDGSLTEIWNIVFIQCNREHDGSIKALSRHHVDTGMGLERLTALLQGVPSNYDTDLFRPLIHAIEKNSKAKAYSGRYSGAAGLELGLELGLERAYRRLADHARMLSVCLADGVYPVTSLNLKQIMRKTFKMCIDVFQNPHLLSQLYTEVARSLGPTYPELIAKEKDAKLIIDHEREAYAKMRADLAKKWKDLAKRYPEVESLSDLEMAGFPLGYKEFKETMSKRNTTVIPGELVFKLYDTHGFQEDVIERIATLNNCTIDKKGFWKLLSNHKSRHKTAFKEQTKQGHMFEKAVDNLVKLRVPTTNDKFKYLYNETSNNETTIEPLNTKLVAILNEEGEWIDFLEACENRSYYLVTENTNFYCEEGGQEADNGVIRINEDVVLQVDSVFKIRDFVFHKGSFVITGERTYLNRESDVVLEINSDRRLNLMRNHTAVHLLNAAIRRVLPNSVICQIGSKVSEAGLSLNLALYGEKLSQKAILEAQELVRESIRSNARVSTRVLDSNALATEADVLTVPGELYPETGLRLITAPLPLPSKELCCGTHAPTTGVLREFCVTLVRGGAGHAPAIHALTHHRARQVRELFCRAQKLSEVIELADPERTKEEAVSIKQQLSELCGGGGAPYGEYAECLSLLETLQKKAVKNDVALTAIAEAEIDEACQEAIREGRSFLVHFLRCSYLMQSDAVRQVLARGNPALPTLLLGCAGGIIVAAARLPQEMVSESLTAERWLGCILPVFHTRALPQDPLAKQLYAEMTATKVSLITCEQMVQDAMRVAIQFARAHIHTHQHSPSQDRRHN